MGECRGTCGRLKEYAPVFPWMPGMRFCPECEYKAITTANLCPCCHQRYRTGPRGSKERLRQLLEKQRLAMKAPA